MKSLFIALTILFLSPFIARAELIRVHGVEVEASNIQYFASSNQIHSFDPVSPVIFPFARGNSLPSGETVYLRQDGTISMMASRVPETVNWLLSGATLSLDCGSKRNGFGEMVPRLVSFHQNGEYKSGCALAKNAKFANSYGQVEVAGAIDLHEDLTLAYSGSVVTGKLWVNGTELNLIAGTELAFYPNGRPNFFTFAKGESFRAKQGTFGDVLFVQSLGRAVSTTLLADGTVEKGILGQDLPFNELGIVIPALSGAGFTVENGQTRLWLAIFSANQTIPALGFPFRASRIGQDPASGNFEAVVAETFIFKRPDGLQMEIPPGSIVTLSATREIVAIRVPAKEEKPFPRKQLSL